MAFLGRLPRSANLKSRLRAWASQYDRLVDTGNEWPRDANEAAWVVDRRLLLKPLKDELVPATTFGTSRAAANSLGSMIDR